MYFSSPRRSVCWCLLSFLGLCLISTDAFVSGETSAECRQRGRISRSFGWMLSDSPQKARPSQSSAQHPPLTLPHSALPDNVTGHDSDELRWRSTLADVYSGRLVKGSETHTECCLFWLCKHSNPITRRYGFACDSS